MALYDAALLGQDRCIAAGGAAAAGGGFDRHPAHPHPRTAEAIFAAGYPGAEPTEEPGLIEQSLGDWQGLRMPSCPPARPCGARLLAAGRPGATAGRREHAQVIAASALPWNGLAETHDGADVIAVAHAGSIRAAVAHALRIGPDNALHLAVQNLSLTRLERSPEGWRVSCVNELPGYRPESGLDSAAAAGCLRRTRVIRAMQRQSPCEGGSSCAAFVGCLALAAILMPGLAHAQGQPQTLVDRATLAIQEMMTQQVSRIRASCCSVPVR